MTEIIQPEGWPAPIGYANGMAATGRIVAVAGQIGWDPRTGVIVSADFAEQAAQALRNVVEVLQTAGARTDHVVRMTWYITNRASYMAARRDIGVTYREIMGSHFPAMSVVVVHGLVEHDADIEIEATAVIPV